MSRSGPGQNHSGPLGTTFFQLFPHSFFYLISGSVFHQQNSKNSSKMEQQSHYFTTLRRLVFRARFGEVKNQKIGVSSIPYAHFRGFRGSKIHTPKTIKKHPKMLKNVSWNHLVFLHGKNEDFGAILEPKMTPKIAKMWPKRVGQINPSLFFWHFSRFRGAN